MQARNSRYLAIAFIIILSLKFVSGVRINEVMPKGNEYVEIYNDGIINLSEWEIQDSSTNKPDEITCWNLENCSLVTNSNYFIIIGRGKDISTITTEKIEYFYVDDNEIGNGMNDNGDSITFYNIISNFSTSFGYNKSEANKSWQFYNNEWQLCSSTPGKVNKCEQTVLNITNSISGNLSSNNSVNKTKSVKATENQVEKSNKSEGIADENGTKIDDNAELKIIRLNSPKDIKSDKIWVYKSKTQYLKDYGIYGFALVCVFVIIILIIKKI